MTATKNLSENQLSVKKTNNKPLNACEIFGFLLQNFYEVM